MTLPNLIGCGAGKSGTTSLYYYLSEHPDIFMALAKEVHFFSQNFDRGVAWYERQFIGAGDTAVVGEFSTSYMVDDKAPERMAEIVPDARLLFIFRDPAERAYSNYWSSMNVGTQEADRDFSEVIRAQSGYDRYIVPGFYFQHLSRFLNYYPRNRIHIMFSHELRRNPEKVMSNCYDFLGVDPTFTPTVEETYNITVTPSTKWQLAVDKTWLSFKSTVKPYFLWIPHSLRRVFSRAEQKIRTKLDSKDRPDMSADDREYLRNIYQEPNQKLAEYLGQDLPWD